MVQREWNPGSRRRRFFWQLNNGNCEVLRHARMRRDSVWKMSYKSSYRKVGAFYGENIEQHCDLEKIVDEKHGEENNSEERKC